MKKILLASLVAASFTASATEWKITTYSDAMTGVVDRYALFIDWRVPSNGVVHPYDKSKLGVMFQCETGRTEGIMSSLVFSEPPKLSGGAKYGEAMAYDFRVKIDDDLTEAEYFMTDEFNSLLFPRPDAAFDKELLGKNTYLQEIKYHGGYSAVYTFSLAGYDAKHKEFTELCDTL